MEEEAKWGSVLVKMSVEIVSEEVVELVSGSDIRARVHHGTSWKILVNCWIFTTIKFIHDDLPDSKRTCWTVLEVSMTLMRHPEVKCVGPKWRILQRSSDGGIIEEVLFFHHSELVIASNPEVRSTETHNGVVRDVGELLRDESATCHLLGPIVDTCLGPEGFVLVVRHRVGGDLVSQPVHVAHGGVVGVLVRHVERALDVASIGILPLLVEDLSVQVYVVVVDGVVEGDCDHLGNPVTGTISRTKTSGNLGTILATIAVRQNTNRLIARGGTVRIIVLVCQEKNILESPEKYFRTIPLKIF